MNCFPKFLLPKIFIWASSFALFFILSQTLMASSISGYVYVRSSRMALPDIDVELQNEYYQSRGRTKTDGSGRYTFSGLSDGYYTVKVMPFRYGFEDQDALVEIVTLKTTGAGQGNAYMTQDFYLSARRGGLLETENSVIFAQDIPDSARKHYDTAIADFSNNRSEIGIQKLRDALKEFPTYYAALHRLGMEMLIRKEYGESAQLFIRAAGINEKSATSLYYLGYALHNLGKEYNKGAIVALKSSLAIAPAAIQSLYLLGKIERIEGNFVDAEIHLLQAKKISKASVPEVQSELAQLYGNDLKKYANAADELDFYLKASKLSSEEEKKTRKIISDLRAKAKKSNGTF